MSQDTANSRLAQQPNGDNGTPKEADLTGRSKLLSNVFSGWGVHLLTIISGFVLPRLINDRLGQAPLGVWDFGWAVVSYFSLLQGGVVSSVNRYVAKHRAQGATQELNAAVSSVAMVLKAMAAVMALLALILCWVIPMLMGPQSAGLGNEMRLVILFLGLTMAVQVQGAVYGGVITGCHRWTAQNAIKTLAALLNVGGGIVVICLGGTIEILAAVMLFSEILTRWVQARVARKICPKLEIAARHFSRKTAWEMVRFGGKSYVNVISQMLVNQTSSVIIASTLGLGALAVFSRPRALVRSVSSVIHSGALVIVPIVGAIDLQQGRAQLAEFAVSATRYAAFLCFPAIMLLSLLGGDVMHLWMGPGYADPILIAIVAITGLSEAMCFPLYRILMGMNQHGRIGLLNLKAACVTLALVAVGAFVFGASLRVIALAVSLPSVCVNSILLPRYAANAVGMRFRTLVYQSFRIPVLCSLPAIFCMIGAVIFIPESGNIRLMVAFGGGALLSCRLYWRHAVPARVKKKVWTILRQPFARLRRAPRRSLPERAL